MRDFAYENPLLLILVALLIVLWILGIVSNILWLLGGVLLGHLFWGTERRKGQKGCDHVRNRWLGR